MAKTKSKSMKKIKGLLPFIITILGVASFCMLFLNALKSGDGDSVSYLEGTKAVFGTKTTLLGQSIEYKFSILGLLAFALPLIGGALALIPVSKKDKGIKFISCFVLFAVGAVLAFIMPNYIKAYIDTIIYSGYQDMDFQLAIGTILSGGLSSLGAICSLAALIK